MYKLRQWSMDVEWPGKKTMEDSYECTKSSLGLLPSNLTSSIQETSEIIKIIPSNTMDVKENPILSPVRRFKTITNVTPSNISYSPTQTKSISGLGHLEIINQNLSPRRYSDTTSDVPSEEKSPSLSQCPAGQIRYNVTIKDKIKTGLETIGVDFMRVNGAISGFKQLKRAEDFKSIHKPKKFIKSYSSASQPPTENKFRSVDSDCKVSFDTLKSEAGGSELSLPKESNDESSEMCKKFTSSKYRRKGNNYRNQKTNKNVGYRLGKRKDLFERRKRITDYALIFALFGIFIMILDLEFIINKVYSSISIYSITLKALLIISTIILIILIMAYHVLEIKIFSWDDSIEDWRIAITWQRIAQMIVEVLVCSIQPIPGNFKFKWVIKNIEKEISWNIVFSLPMLLRLYLILRVILLHSKLFSDAGSRSIGAMNKVSFNISFVLKTVMTTNPGTVLLVFILFIWFVFSWTMRICEVVYDEEHGNLFNSMWLISVTFLSIGYGDIVPHTYCGRGIAIATGVTGSACTALVVAVFARRLELSKAEKHVIHFMFENQLTKQLKYYAANVLRETWLIYKYTKLVKRINSIQVRVHQRKFLRAIHGMRQVKSDQRKLQDNSNTLVDLAKTQTNIYETVTDVRVEQDALRLRLEMLDQNIFILQNTIENLPRMMKEYLSNNRQEFPK